MFTFIIISYNHENYIIEHLESIKYQIKCFGKDKEIQLVISDDYSQDRTIEIANKWLDINNGLFSAIKILQSDNNRGIVNNYLRGISAITCGEYKSLAGDDLYYKNNIFEVLKKHDLVFTPLIAFDDDVIDNMSSMSLLVQYNRKKQISNILKYSNLISAPGVFAKLELSKDDEMIKFVSQYKWIEDFPKWYYIFNLRKDAIDYKLEINPYIMYRTTSGITNSCNIKNKEYITEVEKMKKDFGMRLEKYPKYINPYRYYWKFINLKHIYFDMKYNSELIELNKIMREEISKSADYLNAIRNKAYEFYKLVGKEEFYA
jgi:hypothetical protein